MWIFKTNLLCVYVLIFVPRLDVEVREQLAGLILSFHHVGIGDPTGLIRFEGQAP